MGYDELAPIGPDARNALETYLPMLEAHMRAHKRVGEGPSSERIYRN